MSYILTLDCATDTFCLALGKDSRVVGEIYCQRPRAQLMKLAPCLETLLQTCNVTAGEIELLGVTNGPGSFTGIRLAVTTAKTFGQVCSIPIAPINTIDAIYENVAFTNQTVAVILDARRDEIFTAFYRDGEKLTAYLALTPQAFIEKAQQEYGANLLITGNGLDRYGEMLESALGNTCRYMDYSLWYPRGNGLLRQALKKKQRQETVNCMELLAFYMRRAEAEETLERKQKQCTI